MPDRAIADRVVGAASDVTPAPSPRPGPLHLHLVHRRSSAPYAPTTHSHNATSQSLHTRSNTQLVVQCAAEQPVGLLPMLK